ncbi:hypothetical protein H072_4829 [Dactylellina haptotyla CBS 200.50]|uniref:Beta-glucuronidase C-terminal domain-containing protein n=1 Tax=Dactylellina haptotyla (strain CBS 200.50) TaxID=1284197 RepID=S8BNZ3_DACHA|nr:hypothetical protein H072_4829 [Dactylellina haptotyla CBS 200.50]
MHFHSFSASSLFSFVYFYGSFIVESNAQGGFSTIVDVAPTLATSGPVPTIDRSFVGLSIEHSSLSGFMESQFTNNILNTWQSKTGGRPGIRIGGSGMDKSSFTADQSQPMIVSNQPTTQFSFGPSFLSSINSYFPRDTNIIFGLNLANETNNFANTLDFAINAQERVPQIKKFEIGNEIDNFVRNNLRPQGFSMKQYSQQWGNIAGQMQSKMPGVSFQAAVFAGSSREFNFESLVSAGVKNKNFKIPSYSMHFYPQSFCSAGRAETRINDLVDRDLLRSQLDGYSSDIAAAERGGGRFAFGEANSVSCSGAPSISDTFGAALWMVNFALGSAARNVESIHLHQTLNTPYAMFIPKDNRGLRSGVRPMAYGMVFLAEALKLPARNSRTKFMVKELSPDNNPDLAVYGLYSNRKQRANLGVAASAYLGIGGKSAGAATKTMVSTIRETSTQILGTGIAIEERIRRTSVPRSRITEVRTLTRTRVVTSLSVSSSTGLRTVFDTSTVTISATGNGILTVSRIVQVVGRIQPGVFTVTVTDRATLTQTFVSTIVRPVMETRTVTDTVTITRSQPVTRRIPYNRKTTVTVTVTATAPGNFPTDAGNFLARAVVLNLSRFNTSSEAALNCRSCSEPGPRAFGTPGDRKRSEITMSGFQPGHKLKLFRLQGPGINAKSQVSVSGFQFNEDNGSVATQSKPEEVTVDNNGRVKFAVLASEGALLVDEAIK